MSEINEQLRLDDPRTVLHWYDFLCPFCYVGQSRNAILQRHGLEVIELPFQAHPEIPPAGIEAGPRKGPMYALLDREAREAGLQLNWPPHLPDTRTALAVAEWIRRHHLDVSKQLNKNLFAAHFANGEDLGDPAVIDCHASALGVDLDDLHAALTDGSAEAAVEQAEMIGRQFGVEGTPAWLISRQLIAGLISAAEFERLAENAARQKRRLRSDKAL
jgi:predicted DsbA family dithiol-disulfide isomerase